MNGLNSGTKISAVALCFIALIAVFVALFLPYLLAGAVIVKLAEKRFGGFSWKKAALVGFTIGFVAFVFAQGV